MTTPDQPPETGLDQRVTSLENGQQSILSKLDQLLGGGSRPPAEPERPEVNIAEEIRRQLDKRDRDAKTKTEPAPPAKTEPEQPPKPPVRGITRALWGSDD